MTLTPERRAELKRFQRAEARITALEAALRPFAGFDIVSMAGDCECYVAAYGPNGEKLGDHVMSTADFRRAASLLPGEGNA